VVIVITLLAGLYPKDYRFRNNVTPANNDRGLRFDRYGIAYTAPFVTPEQADSLLTNGFTMTLAVGAEDEQAQDGFALIVLVHSGRDASQLVLGQWKDYLIVMNGDDYRHRLRLPRISARLSPTAKPFRSVTFTSSEAGTRLYLDGELAKENRDLQLSLPSDPRQGRLVLGNSLQGNQPWKGVLGQFALYGRVLSDVEIRMLFEANDTGGEPTGPLVRYSLDRSQGGHVPDDSGNGIELRVPTRKVVVEKHFLAQPFNHQFEVNESFIDDLGINLFGFIPFGVFCSIVLRQRGFRGRRNLLIVFLSAIMLSASIEFAQAWFPSRSSSVIDLALNVLGGVCGALIVLWLARFKVYLLPRS